MGYEAAPVTPKVKSEAVLTAVVSFMATPEMKTRIIPRGRLLSSAAGRRGQEEARGSRKLTAVDSGLGFGGRAEVEWRAAVGRKKLAHSGRYIVGKMAEGAGFEPARVVTPYAISSRAH
jgi:hypothetical protein